MKTDLNCRVIFAGLSIILTVGCASLLPPSRKVSKPSGERYGVVDLTYHRDWLHTDGHSELHYWDKNGKETLVWPVLAGGVISIGTNGAVFKGYLIDGPSDRFPGMRGPIRLFGVNGVGPVIDVTDQIVFLWAKSSGTNISEAIRRSSIGRVERTNDLFVVEVFLSSGPGGRVELNESQLLDIIRETKEKGMQMKDPGSGTPFIKRAVSGFPL